MRSPADERAQWCASIRSAMNEAVQATAPVTISTWMLLEHAGPWPVRGFPDDLDEATRRVLESAEARGVRVQLIRRVRERRRTLRTVVVAGRGGERGWAERREMADVAELAALDLDALAAGSPPGFGEAVDAAEPVVLVCTHGRRDVCCARLGRPVAVRLDAALPGQVWETTHIGGDRFAANVVTLPDGNYHGGLTSDDAPRMAAAVRAGELVLDRWRGECGMHAEEQAAAYFVRAELDEPRVGAVRAVPLATDALTSPARPEADVRVVAGGLGESVVRVRRVALDPRRTSCAEGGTIGAPAAYELVSLRRTPGTTAAPAAQGSESG